MNVRIVRLEGSNLCTRGVILLGGSVRFVTLEDPWLGNQPNISCIPAGVYTCKRVRSEKFGPTFGVENVPDRSLIRFHSGNTAEDTRGCILIGYHYTEIGNKPAVGNSQRAFVKFMESMRGIDSFQLKIQECLE